MSTPVRIKSHNSERDARMSKTRSPGALLKVVRIPSIRETPSAILVRRAKGYRGRRGRGNGRIGEQEGAVVEPVEMTVREKVVRVDMEVERSRRAVSSPSGFRHVSLIIGSQNLEGLDTALWLREDSSDMKTFRVNV